MAVPVSCGGLGCWARSPERVSAAARRTQSLIVVGSCQNVRGLECQTSVRHRSSRSPLCEVTRRAVWTTSIIVGLSQMRYR